MPPLKEVTYYRTVADAFWRAPGRPNLEDFILGTTVPTALNTGLVTSEASLETISTQMIYTTPNVVIENKRFTVTPQVRAANVKFYNCFFNTNNAQGINTTDAACFNCVIERCKFRPSTPGNSSNGPFGKNYTLLRCDVSGSIDCVSIVGSSTETLDLNVNVWGNYLHDQLYTSPNPNHSDNQSHSDTIQLHYGGNNVDIRGNWMPGLLDPTIGQASDPPVSDGQGNHLSGNKYYPSLANLSVLITSPNSVNTGLNNIKFRENWAGGGAAVINWPRSDATGVEITGNRWLRGTRLGDDFTILMQAEQAALISGNYYYDTGVAYNGRKNG